ncbi:hypothetical protein CK516_31835 [Nostoc sp. 'Peltigera malacea cyanobiont' DB3992]|nr:hypothetical protein CK516_31835 [Nostoc sp. 'Peltigera malacea cyanobiont' DB3992]
MVIVKLDYSVLTLILTRSRLLEQVNNSKLKAALIPNPFSQHGRRGTREFAPLSQHGRGAGGEGKPTLPYKIE